jgi:hypothetical protein
VLFFSFHLSLWQNVSAGDTTVIHSLHHTLLVFLFVYSLTYSYSEYDTLPVAAINFDRTFHRRPTSSEHKTTLLKAKMDKLVRGTHKIREGRLRSSSIFMMLLLLLNGYANT